MELLAIFGNLVSCSCLSNFVMQMPLLFAKKDHILNTSCGCLQAEGAVADVAAGRARPVRVLKILHKLTNLEHCITLKTLRQLLNFKNFNFLK